MLAVAAASARCASTHAQFTCCCLQDIRTAMSLLSSAPAVNLELWSQLSRAAGLQGHWQLARECATAALGALLAGQRDLQAVAAAADVPEVSPQGWYWLAVAEMQQGQVRQQAAACAMLASATLGWSKEHLLPATVQLSSHCQVLHTYAVAM
jgi:hypothetical protein